MKMMKISFTSLFFIILINLGETQDITNGLVAYYSFCGCNVNDHSGNENHGNLVGNPLCIDGINGEGFQFNTSSGNNGCGQAGGEYIEIPTLGAIWQDGMSICAWVQYENIANYERIIDMGNGSGDQGGLPVWFGREGNSDNLALESWVSSDGSNRTKGRLTAVNAITNGEIEFYVATISGNIMRIYVNGVMVAEKAGNSVANVERRNNFIGRSNWCQNDPDFKGFMDEVRLYNRALTPDEVALMFESQFSYFGQDVAICKGSEVELLMQGGSSYLWSPSTDLSNVNIPNPIANPKSTTTYTCTITFPDGCHVEESITVTVHEAKESDIQWEICEGEEYDGYSEAGFYLDTLKTLNGCDSFRNLALSVVEAPKLNSVITICEGDDYYGLAESGSYTVFLSNEMGCDTIQQVDLIVEPENIEDIIIEGTICGEAIGKVELILRDPSISYDVLLNGNPSNTAENVIEGLAESDHLISVMDEHNCVFDTLITIDAISCPIFIPNAFSPNDDGVNDILSIYPKELFGFELLDFKVFNRWGEMVYSCENCNETINGIKGWDGKFKGKLVDKGVYAYYIEVLNWGKKEQLKGHITVVY